MFVYIYLARCAGPAESDFPMALHLASGQHVQLLRPQRVDPPSSWTLGTEGADSQRGFRKSGAFLGPASMGDFFSPP